MKEPSDTEQPSLFDQLDLFANAEKLQTGEEETKDFSLECGEEPKHSKVSRIKGLLIESVRWVGAAFLPVPAALAFRFIVLFVMHLGAGRYYEQPTETWWYTGIKVFVCPFFEGVAMSISAYYLAPRAKLLSSSIIITVYATASVIGTAWWLVTCPFDIVKFIGVILCLVGMVVGLVKAHTVE